MAIKIPVIISYDNKGTKQAIKGIGSLDKSLKKMNITRKLTALAGATSITAFGKKAVTAALDESKAIAVLNNSLKNLGLAFAATGVSAYIDSLQRATGVSEDQLRPAFSSLIRATSDLGKAQQLLALALDISAATGKNLNQVSLSLNKAYLGQTTALGRLGLGLSKAELATLNFEQIQKRLTTLFKGSAAAAAETYAGQMAKLKVSAKEASETIGFALIDSVKRLGGDKGIEGAASAMEKFSSEIGFAITGMAVLIDTISNSALGKAFNLFILTPLKAPLNLLARLGKATVASETTATNRQSPRATEAAAAKARGKAILDAQKLLALKKQSAAADKLKAIFDMDLIQLTAAKQGKLSAEELARVNALIALKTTGTADDLKAVKALEEAQTAAAEAEIQRQDKIAAVHKKNAAEILADNKAKAKEYADFVKSFTYPGGLFAGTPLAPTAGNASNAVPTPTMGTALPGFDVGSGAAIFGNPGDQPFMPGDAGYTGTAGQVAVTPNVTVNLQGGINIGSTYEFYQSVQAAVQAANTAGNSLSRAGS